MKEIKFFNELSKNDVSLAGGKGASLGEMTQAGISVPSGFVVLSSAFDRFLEETHLGPEIDSILHKVKQDDINTVENASEQIRALILNSKMSKNLGEEIIKNFKKLGSKYVAVRSSATAEDSASAAWAGQLDSFLNTTEKDLIDNIQKCWASLFTPRAIFYRIEKDLHKEKVSVAVVVQKMVDSVVSGIAFSVHPVSQDKNQLIIEAGLGLGEAIVSGQITPDSYVVEKSPRRIIDKNIADQERGLFRVSNGGNEWKSVKGSEQKLSDKEILELSELILKIEKHYGFPCDVEFAKEKGKFYIVQSRPITTLSDVCTKLSLTDVINKKWVYLVNRPYTLFGASLYQAWFDSPQIFEIFGDSIPDNMYLEEHPNVVRRYVIKEQSENFSNRIRSIIINDRKKVKSILLNGLKFNEEAKRYLEKSPFLDVKSAVDFLVKLTLHATVFSYFSYPIVKEINDKELIELAEKLRAISYYPQIVEKIINPLAKKEVGEDFNLMTLSEILNRDMSQIETRKKESESKRFVYVKINGNEFVEYTNNIMELIGRLENIKIGNSITGQTAYPGKVRGKVRLVLTSNPNIEFKEGDVLVAVTTNPSLMPLILKSSAMVTDEGGITCHAAIVSRELKKPCIIGTKFASHTFKDGDFVEVDADNGVVKILGDFKKKDETLIYEDLFFHDFPLILAQINNQGESVENLPWSDEPFRFKPYCIHARIDGMLHYLYDIEGVEWKKLHAGKFDKEKCIKESYKHYNLIKEIVEKEKALTREELIDFWKKLKETWIWFDCFFWMTEDYERRGLPIDDLLKLRKDTEYLVPGASGCLRNTLKKLFPNDEKYIDVITYEEAIYGKLPPSKILEKRLKEFAYCNNKLFANAQEAMSEYNIELKTDQLDSKQNELKGQMAYPGKVVGKVRIIEMRSQLKDFQKGEILVSSSTTPDLLSAMKISSAIISEHGGAISHAAITSRELKIPCIVGVKNITKILKDGDEVEVDANEGVVRILGNVKSETRIYEPKYQFELEFTRETNITNYYLWFYGYIEACKILNMNLDMPNKTFGIYENGFVKVYTQFDNINLMKNAINNFDKNKLSKLLDEYFKNYDLLNKNLNDEIFMKGLISEFVIMFILGDMRDHPLQKKALDARKKTERLFYDLSKCKLYNKIAPKDKIVLLRKDDQIILNNLEEIDYNSGGIKRLNKDLNPKDYFFLETVPGGYPMDVNYLNLGHIVAPKKRYGIDGGSMYLVFENGGYGIYLEKEKWFDAGGKILNKMTSDKKIISKWEYDFNRWIKDLSKERNYYKKLNFSLLLNKDLFKELDKIINLELRNGLENTEIASNNYGTNLTYKEFEKTLKDIGYEPNKTSQILLRSTGEFSILDYEKEIGKLALWCHNKKINLLNKEIIKKDKVLDKKINELLSKYEWLDASIISPPKSIESVINDVNDILSFGDKIKRILENREKEKKENKAEKDKLLMEVLTKANIRQKNVINFAVKSGETGRILVDEIMHFIYQRRKIYGEIGRRLKISEVDVKFLRLDEIKDFLLNEKKVDVQLIKSRKPLTICLLKGDEVLFFYGDDAKKIKNSLSTLLIDDTPLMQGEIAFSKGKVKGIARLVRDTYEMKKVMHGDILVSSRTYPDLLPAMKKAGGIISELGGLLSHAAIVSRELQIPCIVGVRNAMTKIKDGNVLELDTDKGIIKILEGLKKDEK